MRNPGTPEGRAKGGRNSKLQLTSLRYKAIVSTIAAGNHYHTAAAAAGITYDTLNGWLVKGRKGDPVYAKLAQDVEQAEAEAEKLALAVIQKHAQGFVKKVKRTTTSDDGKSLVTVEESEESDWRAAQFLMQARWGVRWALARKLQFSGALDVRRHVIVHVDPADAQRIIEAEDGVLMLEGKDGELVPLPDDEPADEREGEDEP
jgi:hypothetical protein